MFAFSERNYYENPVFWSPELYKGIELERARLTVEWLPSDVRSVLDAGCGNGVLTNLLRLNCVVGVDRSAAALRWLQKPACQADLAHLPFQDGAFDAVVSTEVLEHIPLPVFQQCLGELVRVARRFILISVPYQENLEFERVRCPSCGCRFHRSYHMRSFAKTDIDMLFANYSCVKLIRAKGAFATKTIRWPQFRNAWGSIRSSLGNHPPSLPDNSICPQCGYARSDTFGPSLVDAPEQSSLPKRVLKACLQNKHTFRWWFALYEKEV